MQKTTFFTLKNHKTSNFQYSQKKFVIIFSRDVTL